MTNRPDSAEPQTDALQAFRACDEKVLEAVLHHDGDEGETITLLFGDAALFLRSDPEIDRLTVSFGPLGDLEGRDDLTGDVPWSRFIGKPFSWGWLTINQRGETDGALLSFDGVIPEVGVNVVASSLETMLLSRVAG